MWGVYDVQKINQTRETSRACRIRIAVALVARLRNSELNLIPCVRSDIASIKIFHRCLLPN